MDAFYASIELRDHPEYKGKPLVVGRPEKRGVVSAASYEARKYGIRSAMPSVKALKLCPDVIFVPGRMEVYKNISHRIQDIFREYTDLVEPLSLDEAFLDVTENKKNVELAIDIARSIKKQIKEELGLTASAGISYNKFLAKIASDYRKPDGLCTIHPDKAIKFIASLPIESFWGVGKATGKKMHSLGIHTGADLQQHSLESLIRHFGKNGQQFYDFAHGIDNRQVDAIRIRQSVGCETTFDKDLTGQMSVIIELYHIACELTERISQKNFLGNTLTLKVKFNDFSQKTHCISSNHPLTNLQEILLLSKKLLQELNIAGHPIRLLGLSVSHPLDRDMKFPQQLSFQF